MLKAYLPVLFFGAFGIALMAIFRSVQAVLGTRKPTREKLEPYECGLPSEIKSGFRFGIGFYLVAMLFLLFDVEILFLYPVALQIKALGAFAAIETATFVALLAVVYAFVWRRGALNWR